MSRAVTSEVRIKTNGVQDLYAVNDCQLLIVSKIETTDINVFFFTITYLYY